MHAHDRTLLANLGFADPDRKDYRHDLACQYLIRPEIAGHVVSLLGQERVARIVGTKYSEEGGGHKILGRYVASKILPRCGRLEVHIGKGEGQYQTTIGFLDVVLPFDCEDQWTGTCTMKNYREVEEPASGKWVVTGHRIIIEVKAHPVEVGDILRQINLYRQYFRASSYGGCLTTQLWVVATIFPVSPLFVDTLKRADIHHIQLGDPFHAWVADQAERADASDVNPESIQL